MSRTPSRLWYACHQPERPTDAFVLWHYTECAGCAIKADMVLRQHPFDPLVQRILGPIVQAADLFDGRGLS